MSTERARRAKISAYTLLGADAGRIYDKWVDITFDPEKRRRTLEERGLDFADAGEVFAGQTATSEDDRQDYGEVRYVTAGYLRGRLVVLVWTPRDDTRRILSMRHAHEREERVWRERMG